MRRRRYLICNPSCPSEPGPADRAEAAVGISSATQRGKQMRKPLPSRTVLFLLLLAGPAGAGEWPQFRGPRGTATAEETGLPIHWGPDQNLRWKADLPGRGLSSPVVARGRVYVTA